ncbi:MAG: glucans biosynthesis glucosyltransferase MdoH [Acetobacteraceae bacterium]
MDLSLDAVTSKSPVREFMPPPAPLDMKRQSLFSAPDRHGRRATPVTSPANIWARRAFVIGGAIILTLFGAYEMNLVLNSVGVSALGVIVLALFVVLGAWISFSFTSSCAGFVSLWRAGGLGLGITRDGSFPTLMTRTAILMPTYNESPERVLTGLRAIHESLVRTGHIDAFDFFILSDTTDPDIWVREEKAYLDLVRDVHGEGRIFYRRRVQNIDRKSGNLEDWVKRHGAAYPQMLTLDADSVMDGGLIARIVSAMEHHENVALIQTLPVIVGGRTLFARMQQFAGRVYGPLIAHGIAWWHGAEGNYWGHNAVIRTRAFAEQAGLPHLPGRKPFGGGILSHDFIEAALMRRGGWAIHMVPGLFGSYEESPPSLTDVAIRDRRWCQGNLQHGRILRAKGLHWVSRMHLLIGIGSYITAPLWLLFLLFGILISLQSHFYRPEYFGDTKMLYPHWPQVDPIQAMYVFFGTMIVLLAPKFMALLATYRDGTTLKGCGGALLMPVSVMFETIISGLIAPIAMLIHTSAVVSILNARDSGWNAQNREDGRVSMREVIRSYWIYSLFGFLLAVAAWSVSYSLFLWMTPVLIGLALAIPLAAATSSRAIGLFLRRLHLLLIPEESAPPEVLLLLETYDANRRTRMEKSRNSYFAEAFHALAQDSALLNAHLHMLPPPRQAGEPIDPHLLVGMLKLQEAPDIDTALYTLSRLEKLAVLTSKEGVLRIVALGTRNI